MKPVSKHPSSIQQLFDGIAPDYDKLNDVMTLGGHRRIKRQLVSQLPLPDSARVLDVCTGTGDLAALLSQHTSTATVIGLDFSPVMLQHARRKHPTLHFVQGDCLHLPFPDQSFDACTVGFGLRNTADLQQALAEIHRILKPEGIFLNIDLGTPPSFLNVVAKPLFFIWASFVGKLFHGGSQPYRYLVASNNDFPAQKALSTLLADTGFTNITNTNYIFGQIAAQIAFKQT